MYAVPPRSTSQPDIPYRNTSDDLSDGVLEDLNLRDAGYGTRQQAIQALGLREDNTDATDLNELEVEHDGETSPVSPDASSGARSTLTIRKRQTRIAGISKVQQEESDLGHMHGPEKIDLATYKQCQQLPKNRAIDIGVSAEKMSSGQQESESGVHVLQAVVLDHDENSPDNRSFEFATSNNAKKTSTSVEAHNITSKTHAPDQPQTEVMELRYKSGQPVRLNDVVIRIRDQETIDGGKNKFDKLDIYDGPFRIIEIPRPTGLSDDFGELANGSQTSSEPVKKDQVKAIQEKLVRLQFPHGTQAKSWTKLGRLRPVVRVPSEVPDEFEARATYYWSKGKGIERTIMNTEEMGNAEDDADNTRGVCHIQSQAYVKVRYIAPDNPDIGDKYEVEKLRGKIIEIHRRKDFPKERMDDPAVVKYLKEGNRIGEKEVLVVKYLIHWAGWPSEDDTYEHGQDNIPQAVIDAYMGGVKPEEIELEIVPGSSPPEHTHKWRKSSAKRYVTT